MATCTDLNGTTALATLAPKVRGLLQALSKQHQQHSTMGVELKAAETEAQKATDEVRRLKVQVAASEAELARSGAALPEGPFTEDIQLARAEREQRILGLRAQMQRERLRTSQAEIDRLKVEIDAAWLEFGKERHQEALSRFEESALALRERFGDILALATIFRGIRLPIPQVMVEDVRAHKAFINSLELGWNVKQRPEERDLYIALLAMQNEIEEVKAGRLPERTDEGLVTP